MPLPHTPISPILISGFTSFVVAVLLVMTTRWHGRHSLDVDMGVQKFHHAPTPRIGGVALFAGLVLACLCVPPAEEALLRPMLFASVPAFAAGLLEDLTKRVGVRERLLATMFSGFVAWLLMGYALDRVEIMGVDLLLAYAPASVAFTAFAVGGVANSINIIDGFNGLAGGVLVICFAAFSLICMQVGDYQLAFLCFLFISVVIGFLLLNFPFGKIFMGDGGAYLMGFLLAWVAVMLPMRNPEVSKWTSLLVCGYPLVETLFSMTRRFWNRAHPGEPDSDHLHSLVKVRLVRKQFPRFSPALRNGAVAPFCWSFGLLMPVSALLFFKEKQLLQLSFASGILLYLLFYWMLLKIKTSDEIDG